MRIGIGLGLGKDPVRAAKDALRQARRAVPRPDLALAFGSIHLDQKKLHRALCRELDPAVLAGGSSYAEITDAGVSTGALAVLLLSLEGRGSVRLACADVGEDLRATGRALAEAAGRASPDRLPLGLVFSGITSGWEHDMLCGIDERIGPLPLFGGLSCGDYDVGMSHPDFWTNYQYSGRRLTSRTARLALLELPEKDFRVSFGYAHGWQPIGPVVTLTRCDGAAVYEVDGMPVLDYYRQFLGREHSDAFFELLVQRYGFSLLTGSEGRSRVKLPVACDFAKGCISYFPAERLEGRKARLIQASRGGLLEGARAAARACRDGLGGERPDLVFAVSCCSRSAILNSRVDNELEAVREVFGRDVPVFGFYSGGEFGPCLNRYADVVDPSAALGGSQYHTTTVCLMALKDLRGTRACVPSPRPLSERTRERAELARVKSLLAKSEGTLDDTERFLANLSWKSYQDGERLRRQNEVIHRYTPHDVFRRVGDEAAKGGYELPDSEFVGCFLFMDVKGFTSYSETHSPAEVVSALNAIFKPATDAIYRRGGDVDKYIGDCIFAAFRDPQAALEAGRELLELTRDLQAGGSPFGVRIGINAGRAVRANVGSSLRREYTFIGDAVNLAQRLESNCTPGKLLVCAELQERGKALFPKAERRELTVKGKRASVVACEFSL